MKQKMEIGKLFLQVLNLVYNLLTGIGFLTMDMYNEIWNALLFYYTDNYSAIWMCNHPSVY